jgi:hypothetical protein
MAPTKGKGKEERAAPNSLALKLLSLFPCISQAFRLSSPSIPLPPHCWPKIGKEVRVCYGVGYSFFVRFSRCDTR